MSTTPTFKHWMHQFHDGGAKVAHYTGHLLHEKAFWIILAFVLLTAGLFTLIVLLGNGAAMQDYRMTWPPMIH